jgi:hypothetical protein
MARWSRTPRYLIALLVAGIAGIGLAGPPTPSWADEECGRVYLTNTQNELLLLRRPAQFLANLDAPTPDVQRQLRGRLQIAGLDDGETLIGIDFRPSNGVLYGVGRIGNAAMGQLYTIDVETGAATKVGALTIPLDGAAFGVDFNPVPDRLRVVSDTGQNLRINPDTGAVAGTDTTLTYVAGDPNTGRAPGVTAVAYTNPDADPRTNTVLHDVDVNRGADVGSAVLGIQVPPNGGVVNTIGQSGVDADGLAAFDIGPNNEGLAALRPSGSPFSHLYAVDLASGQAIDRGQIAKGELINGLAIQVGPVCVP